MATELLALQDVFALYIRGSFVLLSIRLKYLQESTVVLVQNYCRTWLASKRSRRRTRLFIIVSDMIG